MPRVMTTYRKDDPNAPPPWSPPEPRVLRKPHTRHDTLLEAVAAPAVAQPTPRPRAKRPRAEVSPHFTPATPPTTPRRRARAVKDEEGAEATPTRSSPRRRAKAVKIEPGASDDDDGTESPYFPPSPPASPSKRQRKAKKAAAETDEPKLPTREMLPHGIKPDPEHFGLIQEVVCEDKTPLGTWKMLIATCLLNQTSARPVLWQILERWPTPADLAAADLAELTDVLYPIGLFNIRARRLIAFSAAFVAEPPDPTKLHRNKSDKLYDPTPISHYPGVGRYALDSYRIFIGPEPETWRTIIPLDKELRAYLIWRHAKEGKLFDVLKGVVGDLPPDFELPVR